MEKSRVFFLMVILFLFAMQYVFCQVSKNNFTGDWTSNTSWVGNVAPATVNINGNNIDIFGYITRTGNLSFSNDNQAHTIRIADTLVVIGDLSFANKAMNLNIAAGSVFIVIGNFSAENKIDVDNGGVFVVSGTMSFSPSGQDEFSNAGGELFVNGSISGNSTASGANLGFSELEIRYPEIYAFVMSGGGGLLPIELLSFKANVYQSIVHLSWQTASELNNDFFTLEKSKDGIHYTSFAVIQGVGTTKIQQDYSYIDEEPFPGLSYYRLKQTDFDGTTETFRPVSVVFSEGESTFSLYPNPLKQDELTISWGEAVFFEGGKLSVFSVSGSKIFETTLSTPQTSVQQFNMSFLPKGSYIVNLSNRNTSQNLKLIRE